MKNQLVINNPERVGRILVRICDSKLRVLLRSHAGSTIAIKGIAVNAHLSSDSPQILISQISPKGIEILNQLDELYVEFIMMSTKIFFTCRKKMVSNNSVYITIPTHLTSVERRQNVRFPTTPDYSAYFDFEVLAHQKHNFSAPHTLSYFGFLRNRLLLTDISANGACVTTEFPFAKEILVPNLVDHGSKLILPLKNPIHLPAEVRWFKKIKEHIDGGVGRNRAVLAYKMGLQFKEEFLTEDTRAKISQFINILGQSQAI